MTVKGYLRNTIHKANSVYLSLPFVNPLFSEIEIETIRACNRHCEYCPIHTVGGPKGRMDEKVYIKIIDSLARVGFKGRLSPHLYGEPLLDPRIEKLITYTRQKLPQANIKLYTNADLLTPKIYLRLIKVGVTSFAISQHTSALAPNIVKTLSFIKKKYPHLYRVRIYNFYDIYFNQNNPNGTLFTNRGGTTNVKPQRQTYCYQVNQMSIDFQGNAVICSNDYSAEKTFGNVNHEDIIDIWFKKDYVNARHQINAGHWPFDICKKCKLGTAS